jgi:phosphoribosylanthranilate isomerase
MVKVKICGLTRPEDVEKAVELGADALGFVCEPTSPRYVEPRVRELLALVPPYLMAVGVFGEFSSVDTSLFNCVQFSEFVSSTSIFASVGMNLLPPAIKAIRLRPGADAGLTLKMAQDWLDQHHVSVRGWLLDAYHETQHGGTGTQVDWRIAAEFVRASALPVILAGGLTPDNVATAIGEVGPYAVDVSSGIESSPGVKDHVKMRDFIQAAKSGMGL